MRIWAALVRTYASMSRYGAPFEPPKLFPFVARSESGRELRLYLGAVPPWLERAVSRRRKAGELILKGVFQGLRTRRDEVEPLLDAADATPAIMVDAGQKHQWTVTIALIEEFDLEPDASLLETRWIWWLGDVKGALSTQDVMNSRAGRIDLIAEVLRRKLPNVLQDVIEEGVFISREDAFEDAIGLPLWQVGMVSVSVQTPISTIDELMGEVVWTRALSRALDVEPEGLDETRQRLLKEAARSGRLRDAAGFYGKHELPRDIQFGLLHSSAEYPLAVVYVDMNGLKAINDTNGHDAGDRAIASFQTLLKEFAQRDARYRDGGDEFILLFNDISRQELSRRMQDFLSKLKAESLSASVGIVFCSDPSEDPKKIKDRADQEMFRAKKQSKIRQPRPAAMAIEGEDVVLIDGVAAEAPTAGASSSPSGSETVGVEGE